MGLDDHLIVEVVMEKRKWGGSWPAKCDLCYSEGSELYLSDYLFFVDGRTKQGPWALMCPLCHKIHGVGLGIGKGQKYDSKTLEKLEG